MVKYISCGKMNINYKYLLISLILSLLSTTLQGFNYFENFESVLDSRLIETFSKHKIIKNLYSNIAIILTSLILNKIQKVQKISTSEHLTSVGSMDSEKTPELIFEENEETSVNTHFSKIMFTFYILIWVLEVTFFDFFFAEYIDFWMLELIIVTFLNSIMFKEHIYKHHKLVLWLLLIPISFKIATIIICYSLRSKINDKSKFFYENEEKYLRKKTLFMIYDSAFPIEVLGYFLLISWRSFVNLKIKWLMDKKYISEFKILFFYGAIGFGINLVLCIIFSIVPCNEENSEVKNYFCEIKYEGYYYYDNIISYFSSFEVDSLLIVEILLIIISSFISSLIVYYLLNIIKNLSPVHCPFLFPIIYFCEKLIGIINTYARTGELFTEKREFDAKEKLILDLFGDLSSLIGYIIFLEFIELNFCGFNKNLRANIIIRGFSETNQNNLMEPPNEE